MWNDLMIKEIADSRVAELRRQALGRPVRRRRPDRFSGLAQRIAARYRRTVHAIDLPRQRTVREAAAGRLETCSTPQCS